ncbi:MAG TPA: penicillin-binding protein activator [Candidatus Saccharimonadales bacterium]|nr:penicillin-binding protein activator [Candidatus Saccharimonadales bacterium]
MQNEEMPPMDTGQESVSQPPKKRRRRFVVFVVVFVLMLAIGAGLVTWYQITRTPKPKPTVKVGVLMAFTGGSSSMGYGTMKGIQLAKKHLGANTVDIIQADSQCDPNVAREAVKKLIDQSVAAIIGDGCSSASVAVLPTANNTKTPMVSPSASSTTLSIPNDYFFRVVPPDSYQATFMAEAIHNKGIQKVAVFYTNEPYGSNMNKAFQEKFESLGGKVVATAYAEPDDIALSAQIQKLKDSNPEGMFIAPNSVVSATAAIQIARQVGIKVPLFGADIFYDQTVISNAPTASAGLTITSFPTGSTTFKQMLQSEYKVVEQLYAAPQAYDAFEAIYRAIQQGATTGEQIKNTLPQISFNGMSADIKFDENGEEKGDGYDYDVLQVQNGTFVKLDKM